MPNNALPPADAGQGVVSPYVYLLVFSGTLLVISFALSQLHFGKQQGLGYDYVGRMGANLLHVLLSYLRPASFALAVTGLVGWTAEIAHRPPEKRLTLALCAGAVTLIAAYSVPAALCRLDARAKRLPATENQLCVVIDTIPPKGSGFGKVRARKDNRTADFVAESTGAEFGVGMRVRIVNVIEGGHVEVGPDVPEITVQVSASDQPEA
jgi:hypothetical protein